MSDVKVPEGWDVTTLGKVAKLVMGQSPSSDTYNTENNGLPFFQGKADFGFRHPQIRYWCSDPIRVVGEQTILFSVRAPVGDVNITPYTCSIGRGLAGIQGETVNQEFLFQKLQHVKPQFQLLSQGSTFEALNGSDLKEFCLALPPLPEQQKIATILTSVDTVIEKTRAQIDKLKHLKTAMMQELLTKGIGHTEFKDSPVGRIPKGWEVFPMERALDVIIDYRGKSPPKSEVGIPLITAKNIRQGYIDVDPKEYIYEDQYDSWMVRGLPVEGDVFITTEAPLGNVARVPAYKFAIGQRVLTLRPKDFIVTDYLLYTMQSEYFREQLDLESTGSTVAGIKQSTFRNILIPVPPKVEQQKIAKPLNAINEQIDVIGKKLKSTVAMKKAIMQDLLTGKVRVENK